MTVMASLAPNWQVMGLMPRCTGRVTATHSTPSRPWVSDSRKPLSHMSEHRQRGGARLPCPAKALPKNLSYDNDRGNVQLRVTLMAVVPLYSLAIGLASSVPGLRHLTGRKTGGTDSARYCYSVWLRHLWMTHTHGLRTEFDTMVELGPGDSVGVGLAALLSGTERYIGIDTFPYPKTTLNLRVLEELIVLFRSHANVPDQTEFPRLMPPLAAYAFPDHILTPKRLARSLSPARIDAIRSALKDPAKRADQRERIAYLAPWRPDMIPLRSVDLVLSQGVMQFVDDLPAAYRGMAAWLTPNGVMSHEIAYQSIGITREWNGHWICPELLWRVAAGQRRHVTNRQPHSEHLRLIAESGCQIATNVAVKRESRIRRADLTPRFRHLSDQDLVTGSALIQATRLEP